MRITRTSCGLALAAIPAGLALLLVGCGEKITIPEPRGLFGTATYYLDDVYDEPSPIQVLVAKGYLFVLDASGRLSQRDQDYGLLHQVNDLLQPTALCADDSGDLLFVWEQGPRRVSIYTVSDLVLQERHKLMAEPVRRVVGMAASRAGIEAVPGAHTFLYLSDPERGVVYRYAYDDYSGLSPYGVLTQCTRPGSQLVGEGVRFVHRPAGLARDGADSLLVCDLDTKRNWVIRFSSVPDHTDVTPSTTDRDPWRGLAVRFGLRSCVRDVPADYTLGKAEECEGEWLPGPSSKPGEFDAPTALAIDGEGKIYVADSGNDRVQVFGPQGEYVKLLGGPEDMPHPISVAVVDQPKGSRYYGGYVFVVVPDLQQVRKFISSQQREHERHIEPDQ
jgi:hypothetical protein